MTRSLYCHHIPLMQGDSAVIGKTVDALLTWQLNLHLYFSINWIMIQELSKDRARRMGSKL